MSTSIIVDTLIWDGKGTITEFAAKTARTIPNEASHICDTDQRQKLFKHATNSESKRSLVAMTDLAKNKLSISIGHLDADPMLFGIIDGVLDLTTGRLQNPDRADYITKQATVSHDIAAKCPRFLSFLNEIFKGNEELIAYIQRLMGYILTGSTSEQVAIIFYGIGANGKSVLIRLIELLLGDYAKPTDPQTFMEKRIPGGATPELAELRGARLVTTTEPNQYCELDESLIKRVTGQDQISCRSIYQKPFSYLPQFKIVIATNHRPTIKGTDYGIWRRIHLVPFEVTIPEKERDKELLEKLKVELPGILNWALAGLMEWRNSGLRPPAKIRHATQQYRNEMDVFEDWLHACCETAPEFGPTETGVLFESFIDFCKKEETPACSKKSFSLKLTEKGYTEKRTSRTRKRAGIHLLLAEGQDCITNYAGNGSRVDATGCQK